MRWVIIFGLALLAFTCVRDAQAWPHTDRPGYHHCPVSAKVGPGDCRNGAGGGVKEPHTLAEGNVLRTAIEDDEAGRHHHPRNHDDRVSFGMVDDYFRWLHGLDGRHLRYERRKHRADECRRAHELYLWRHGLRGPYRNDCHGWLRDKRWHERHPAELSTFLGIGV